MFPYCDLVLTWEFDGGCIECHSDRELESKIRFDLSEKKKHFIFVIHAKGLISPQNTTKQIEVIDLEKEKIVNNQKNAKRKVDSVASVPPAKKKAKSNTNDPFASLTSGQKQSLFDELQIKEPRPENIRMFLKKANWFFYPCVSKSNSFHYYLPEREPGAMDLVATKDFFPSLSDFDLPRIIRILIS